MLRHINREYGANFNLDAFRHRAEYNAEQGRIEMRLDALSDMRIRLGGEEIAIAKGEAILTEYSYKYTLDSFAALAQEAGFEASRVWTDADNLFSVQYCERR